MRIYIRNAHLKNFVIFHDLILNTNFSLQSRQLRPKRTEIINPKILLWQSLFEPNAAKTRI